ncbi:hypothetical protein ABIA96_001754 [Bradyrhizobium sp. LB11.1]
MPTLMSTEEEMRSEPRYSNDRQIWSHRKRRVPYAIHIQILRFDCQRAHAPTPTRRYLGVLAPLTGLTQASAAILALFA